MAIKTFNIDSEVYELYSTYCKKHGISMSKRVEHFIQEEVSKIKDKLPSVKKPVVKKPVVENKKSPTGHHSFSKYC